MVSTPIPSTIHGWFAAQAEGRPEALAVVQGDRQLTYAQLDAQANRLANRLVALGVVPESRVAVLQERGVNLVVSMLAVLKAGACYVPLHAGYPPARMELVMADALPTVLLLDREWEDVKFSHGARVVVVDEEMLGSPSMSDADPAVPLHGDMLAYVIHTSGSTGVPKGVAVSHRAVVGLARDECWADGAHEAVLWLAPYAFDISTYELWVPLLNGGRVVAAPPVQIDGRTLRDLLVQHDITAVHLTAGLFGAVADEYPETFAGVREVLTGGDRVAAGGVSRVLKQCPGTRVRHLYGPTEITLFATHAVLEGAWPSDRQLPLGRAREAMRVSVLDAGMRPVSPGETGELFVGGSGVARGYLGRPSLTAERFVPDPHGAPGDRLYATGDFARVDAEGSLEFLGRADDQVKIRGYRVELGEVEVALGRVPGVSRAAAATMADPFGAPVLVAFAVVEPGCRLDGRGIRNQVAVDLPEYMVPATVTVVETLPLTPNGKVDRAALPAAGSRPTAGADMSTAAEPGTSQIEHGLCEIFAKVLGLATVQVDDSFVDLGGDSLRGFRLVRMVAREFGGGVPIRQLFRTPTPAGLAAWLAGREPHRARGSG